MMIGPNSVDFHDATLHSVSIDWRAQTCAVDVSLTVGGRVTVVWPNVTNVSVPHEAPWGKSVSINAVGSPKAGTYEVEMQSGDTIVICAGEPRMK
jgi:hypothetical protein